MYVALNCITIDSDASNRQELSTFLGHFGVHVVGSYPSVETLGQMLVGPNAPQLVIVNLDPSPADTLKKVGHLPRQFPAVSFFLMSQTLDASLLMEAMHLGIKEFIPLPIAQEKFAAAIERVASSHGMGKRAKIIHVVPTMGGCGSTTISCNVAASLAKQSKTVLIDMDLIRGGVSSYFDIKPRYTIGDVMESAEKLDQQLLDNALAIHTNSKLAILARPDLPEESLRVTQTGFSRLTGVLGRMFDYVVLDSLMSIDAVATHSIQQADLNVIVMQLNVPSAKNAERYIGALRRMGVDSGKIKIVVNRYVKKGWDIEPEEVERLLGLKISWMIPNDFKNAIAAINYGEPVVLRSPKSEMSVSLMELATQLHGSQVKKAA